MTGFETKDGSFNTDFDGTAIPTIFKTVGEDYNKVLTFASEPQIVISEGTYTTVLTTTVMGETTIEEQSGEEFFEFDEWGL